MPSAADLAAPPSLRALTTTFAQVAAQSFGGPAGQVAVMHRIVVDERRWVRDADFVHALGFCMLLPGPEAQQLATFLGWRLHGLRGGLIAGGLFILPGFVSILALSLLIVHLPQATWLAGALFGLRAAALALIVDAGLRMGRRIATGRAQRSIAALAFGLSLIGLVDFPLIVLGALAAGLLGVGRAATAPTNPQAAPPAARPALSGTLRTAGVWLLLWLGPVCALRVAFGPEHVLVELAQFFASAATVTFGGAYAVLAHVSTHAVEVKGWLGPGEMLDALSMAETTPGPLIQMVQHVGFLAAWRAPGSLSPLAAGLSGAVVTTWVTFMPSFLWIFAGAPYVEWLREVPRLRQALVCVSAAVVGVLAHLALWMATHVCWSQHTAIALPAGARLHLPEPSSANPAAMALTAAAVVALVWGKWSAPRTMMAAALLGVAWTLRTG